jgi:hypothetical protein
MTKPTQNLKSIEESAGSQAEALSPAPAAPAPGSIASKGAPPSNTAPPNCMDGTYIIRTGIDSLYISHKGVLPFEQDLEMRRRKTAAQSNDPEQRATARLRLMDHDFEVKDKGRGRFPFVLADNWYQISLSSNVSTALPLAMTQISSEVLTRSGLDSATSKLRGIIKQLGNSEAETISRVDLCVDFVTDFDFLTISQKDWVCRSSRFSSFYEDQHCSGFTFGAGGAISARLYDKSLEIRKSKKACLYEVWTQHDWQGELPVWRMEFQFKRAVLLELGINGISDLKENLDRLWRYACLDWLRLVIPSESDDTKSRWLSHPLWEMLCSANFGTTNHAPLQRTRKERVPSDERLFVHGLGVVSSYMAKFGVMDVATAFQRLYEDAGVYFGKTPGRKGSLEHYLTTRAMEKSRRFNTLTQREAEITADQYRKAKEGE